MSDTERQIEDTIDQAANPLAGEQVEGLTSPDDTSRDAEPLPPTEAPPAEEPAAAEPAPPTWSPPSPERTDEPAPFEAPPEEPTEPVEYEPPTQEQPAVPPSEGEEEKKDDDGGSDWRTWSGRSVNP
jgi:hypothetical protein